MHRACRRLPCSMTLCSCCVLDWSVVYVMTLGEFTFPFYHLLCCGSESTQSSTSFRNQISPFLCLSTKKNAQLAESSCRSRSICWRSLRQRNDAINAITVTLSLLGNFLIKLNTQKSSHKMQNKTARFAVNKLLSVCMHIRNNDVLSVILLKAYLFMRQVSAV